MRITVLPQRKHVEISGRRRAADVLRELGFLPGTAMVIRGDELVPEGSMLEADDVIEIRSVISGGAPSPLRTGPGHGAPRRTA
jgi:sulfur carrier protein ThiS